MINNGQGIWNGNASGIVTSIGFLTTTSTPTPLAGVPSAMAGVEASTSELMNVIARLTERLEQAGVLRPSPPSAGNADKAAPNFNTSLANAIDQQRLRVHQAIGGILDIHERIDL